MDYIGKLDGCNRQVDIEFVVWYNRVYDGMELKVECMAQENQALDIR